MTRLGAYVRGLPAPYVFSLDARTVPRSFFVVPQLGGQHWLDDQDLDQRQQARSGVLRRAESTVETARQVLGEVANSLAQIRGEQEMQIESDPLGDINLDSLYEWKTVRVVLQLEDSPYTHGQLIDPSDHAPWSDL